METQDTLESTPVNKCRQCGNCCSLDVPNCWDTYRQSDLTKEEFKQLASAINDCCKALTVYNGKAICLVEHLFGKDKKPKACRDWHCDKG